MVVPTGRAALMRWQAAALSDRGRQRARNEDAFLLRPDAQVFAVADGMGGHAAGDVASQLAIRCLSDAFPSSPSPRIGPTTLSRRLLAAFELANAALLRHAAQHPECSGMGTTLTAVAALRAAPQCVVAHVGDTRAYRMRGGQLVQLTADHTWVQQQVDAGMLTPVEARHHPWAPLLNRVLGTPALGPADTYVVDVAVGDTFLLCTDGLTGLVDSADLTAMMARPLPLEEHVRDLIAAANLRGGHDNITVVLLRAV
jgi:PPM family protein phosphatase